MNHPVTRLSTLGLIVLLWPLAGCYDIDVTARVNDDKTVTMISLTEIDREFYDTDEDDDGSCPKDKAEIGEKTVVCHEEHTSGLGTLKVRPDDPDPSEIGDPTITATEIDDGVIRVSFPLQDLKDSALARAASARPGQDLTSAEALLSITLADHTLSLNVTGNEIVDTNGTLSEDGKSASLVIPLVDLVGTDLDHLPAAFTADVRLHGCSFWIFCG